MKFELKEIVNLVNGLVLNDRNIDEIYIYNICTDTRKLENGDCFLALKGGSFNGNNFALEAGTKGASVIFIDEILFDKGKLKDFSCPIILVENCLHAYAMIANFYRNSLKTKIIGVTGSVGKTTTKNLLGHCLNFATNGMAFASAANLNNQVGVPQNLLMIKEDIKYAVIEMGMQTKGEIDFLSRTAEPDIAIINNISPAHLEYFDDLSGIAEAKAEIFNGLKANGIIILNKNTNYFDLLYKKAKEYSDKIILYSINSDEKSCDIKIEEYRINEDNSVNIDILVDGEKVKYRLSLGAISLIENSLVVFAVFKVLNIDYEIAVKSLESFSIENLVGRGQILTKKFHGKNLTIIDETYNSGVQAMQGALKNLISLPFSDRNIKRRVAILGEMRELGNDAMKIHCNLINFLDDVDFVITIGGDNIKALNDIISREKNGGHFENSEDILNHLDDLLNDGDLLLIKGARGNYLERIVNYIDSGS